MKLIPGTQGFMVSADGIVYGPDGIIRPQYKNSDGYHTASVLLYNNKWQTFGVHRLMALAYLSIPDGYVAEDLVVNHIDGDIDNNSISNLEWVTTDINNLHASLIRDIVKYPTIIMSDENGNKSFIKNLHDAASKLGITISVAWDMIKSKRTIGGISLTPFTRTTRIPKELHKDQIKEHNSLGRVPEQAVYIKNLNTGDVVHFSSMNDAARTHQTTASHIHQCITDTNNTRLFKQNYLVMKTLNFPKIDDHTLTEMRSSLGKRTYVYNTKTKMYYTFESASSFINQFKLSKKSVTSQLRNCNFGKSGEWVFSYDKNRDLISKE